MRILVTGGTGNVGRLVVEELVQAGVIVRVLSRRPGTVLPGDVEVFHGDLAEPESLRPALQHVDRMYLFPFAATAPDVVHLAEHSGVRRIVTLSSGAVTTGHDTNFHLPVEQAVQASGMEWTHVRPGEFMLNNLWLWGPSIRTERAVHEPFPDRTGRPVHERDVADVAAAALLEDGHQHSAYTLNGPELLSRRDQVRAIAEAIGQHIRLEVVTPAQARDLYLAQGGFAAASAEFLTGFQTYSGAAADPTTVPQPGPETLDRAPTAQDVTGTPARTFTAWSREHARDFLAPSEQEP
ncbi:NAD(P)H-binding protein [Dactylosporangium sp. NBC_01737]|uniref:SDR family oxidoreductase n=1 Tax=Dactylosporangium sp. NBC_01737 TaxID=2975959 RepID=UPI002E0EED8E|nr:NAD(P)H-binding protein [Dactylosporangium sp. NBC_01737]